MRARRNSRERKARLAALDGCSVALALRTCVLALACLWLTRANVHHVLASWEEGAREAAAVDELRAAAEAHAAHLGALTERLGAPAPAAQAHGTAIESDLGASTELLEAVAARLRRPADANLVAILGVDFILKRDFEIWDQTFGKAQFRVAKTSKKKMARGEQGDWAVLKCLDLFDGKSHCIEPRQLLELRRWQRVSRLYGLRKTLWNKDRFCETMQSALRGFEGQLALEFVFPCWMLPVDYSDLMRQARGPLAKRSFILKPTDRGEGNGIVVMDSARQLQNWKTKFPDNDEVVVQTYLPNPFLINGRKWDMRTYVLVTSVNPLRAYMFRDGLVRFASSRYDAKAKGGGKATSFLTNTSVNKKSGVAVDDLTWPFPKMYRWLRKNRFDADLLWRRIEDAVTQLLLSSEPAFVHLFQDLRRGFTCANCYQLLGVDVIVDDDMVPRVIELNGEPSMQLTGESDSHYDKTKTSMAHDLVQLVFHDRNVAQALAADIMELQLEGFSIGFERLGCAKNGAPAIDFCLDEADVEYLVDMKREQASMGGFRRIYPSARGDQYAPFVEHLRTKFPRDTSTGSFKVHALATMLAKLASNQPAQDNSIDDPDFVEADEPAAATT